MTLDSIAPRAPPRHDVLQQGDQRSQLRLRKSIDAISIIDQLDGDGPTAVAQHMVGQLIFGNTGASRAVAINYVVNPSTGWASICWRLSSRLPALTQTGRPVEASQNGPPVE